MTDDANRDAALAAAAARAMPAVATRTSSLGLALGIAAVALIGAVSFYALNAARITAPSPNGLPMVAGAIAGSNSLPSPPVLPPAQVAFAPAPQPMVQAPMAMPAPPPEPPPLRRNVSGPALIVDLSLPAPGASEAGRNPAAPEKLNANEAFAARLAGVAPNTVTADRIASTRMVVPQGSIIVAVLETAINSDLPGQVRAVVSRDVLGFDASKVLVPRGSRLIGEYSSGVALGQSRAFVIWTRLLRPDGVSVQFASSATDELGAAGLAGKVSTHFLKRFGAATLLSVITSGLDYLANSALSGGGVIIGSSNQATQLAGIALQRQIDIPPTIRIVQGTPVRVLVSRDLDFSPLAPKP